MSSDHLRKMLWKPALGLMACCVALMGAGCATKAGLTSVTEPQDKLQELSSLSSGTLNIWFPGSQDLSARQETILTEFHQDFPNSRINIRNVPRSSFVADWLAASEDTMPDLAFIDDSSLLHPFSEQSAVWEDWGHDRFQLNGWWVIFKHSRHVESSRAFLRWLAASPHWRPVTVRNDRLSAPDINTIEAKALAGLAALRSGNPNDLETLLDPEAGRAGDDLSFRGIAVISARPLQTFGNPRLAFTTLEVTASNDRFYGLRFMSFIFRRRNGEWRILRLDRDTTLARVETLFGEFDGRITLDDAPSPLPEPVLDEPRDNAQIPLPASRSPELAWTMETGAASSFLVEMQMGVTHTTAPPPINTGDLTDSYLVFSVEPADKPEYRIVAPFGVNAQPYRVRIWALDSSGQTSFSDWHTMYFIIPPPATSMGGRHDELVPAPRVAEATDAKAIKNLIGSLVEVAGGKYLAVNPWRSTEQPISLTLKRFRVGSAAVTRALFRRFVEATQYRTDAERGQGGGIATFDCCSYSFQTHEWDHSAPCDWRDSRFGSSDDVPVVCISANDVGAFLKWLNELTGRRFRLPTAEEAEFVEWPYAQRAALRLDSAQDRTRSAGKEEISGEESADAEPCPVEVDRIDEGGRGSIVRVPHPTHEPQVAPPDRTTWRRGAPPKGFPDDPHANVWEIDSDNYCDRGEEADECLYEWYRGPAWWRTPCALAETNRFHFGPARSPYLGFRLAED